MYGTAVTFFHSGIFHLFCISFIQKNQFHIAMLSIIKIHRALLSIQPRRQLCKLGPQAESPIWARALYQGSLLYRELPELIYPCSNTFRGFLRLIAVVQRQPAEGSVLFCG